MDQSFESELDEEDFNFLNANIRSYEDATTILSHLQKQQNDDSLTLFSFFHNLSDQTTRTNLNHAYTNLTSTINQIQTNINKATEDPDTICSPPITSKNQLHALNYINLNATLALEHLQKSSITEFSANSTIKFFIENKSIENPIAFYNSIKFIKRLSKNPLEANASNYLSMINQVDHIIRNFEFQPTDPFIPYSKFRRYLNAENELFDDYIKKLVQDYISDYNAKGKFKAMQFKLQLHSFAIEDHIDQILIEIVRAIYRSDKAIDVPISRKNSEMLASLRSEYQEELDRIAKYFYNPFTIEYIKNLPETDKEIKMILNKDCENLHNSLLNHELNDCIGKYLNSKFEIFRKRRELDRISQISRLKKCFEERINRLLSESTANNYYERIYYYFQSAGINEDIRNKFNYARQITIQNLHEEFHKLGNSMCCKSVLKPAVLFNSQKLREAFIAVKRTLDDFPLFEVRECFVIGYLGRYYQYLGYYNAFQSPLSDFKSYFNNPNVSKQGTFQDTMIKLITDFMNKFLRETLNMNDIQGLCMIQHEHRSQIQERYYKYLNIFIEIIEEFKRGDSDLSNLNKHFLNSLCKL